MIDRALIIGYGSIGSRHARILTDLGVKVSVISRHAASEPGLAVFATLEQAFRSSPPDYVVIANETSHHRRALTDLTSVGFSGPVLVEKPLMANIDEAGFVSEHNARVAYNLRFHPVLRALAASIKDDCVLSVQVYAGQYLPDWRPGTDYSRSYSARRVLGGGVLRDLSHEIDYVRWIFGPWKRLAALGGKRSALDIDSDDAWCVTMETLQGSMLSLQLNYLDRVARREIIVVGENHSYRANLVAGTLDIDNVTEHFNVERDTTYLEQHKAALDGRWEEFCSWGEGLAVLRTIACIEQAATDQVWVFQ